jgi:predicted RNA-binding Zn-ribbon protein involved in translation (DUF1610 family)
MNIKCPNCGGSMMLDPESGMMKCNQCGGGIKSKEDIEDIKKTEDKCTDYIAKDFNNAYGVGGMGELEIQSSFSTGEKMEIREYRCTSCGARLMINGTEASTFCSFCGQPTIVFDRVSQEVKPNYIMPFAISQEKATQLIKEALRKKSYVPKSIKNPNIENVRGIYIPYWLYSVTVRKQANLNTQVKKNTVSVMGNRNVVTEVRHYYRNMVATYRKIPQDASCRLNNQLSQRLEPFDMHGLKPFDAQYMSGFYADRYDVEPEAVNNIIKKRAMEMVDKELKSTCMERNATIVRSMEDYAVNHVEYALLPAWFMTVKCNKELYTVMVNGQTGKVVASLPMNKPKVTAVFALLTLFFSIICSLVIIQALCFTSEAALRMVSLIIILCPGTFISGMRKYMRHKYFNDKVKAHTTLSYIRERQDKTWIR